MMSKWKKRNNNGICSLAEKHVKVKFRHKQQSKRYRRTNLPYIRFIFRVYFLFANVSPTACTRPRLGWVGVQKQHHLHRTVDFMFLPS